MRELAGAEKKICNLIDRLMKAMAIDVIAFLCGKIRDMLLIVRWLISILSL